MARSVLRLADQRAGRFPDRCVLSGVRTDQAVRCRAVRWRGRRWMLGVLGATWLLGPASRRRSEVVALPVAAAVWSGWHRRNLLAVLTVVFGLGLVGGGLLRQEGGLLTLGIVVVVLAGAYRARAHHNYWTTCVLASSGDLVVVEPTHPNFDRQARDIFTRRPGGGIGPPTADRS